MVTTVDIDTVAVVVEWMRAMPVHTTTKTTMTTTTTQEAIFLVYVFGYEDSLYGTHDNNNDDDNDDDDDNHTGSDLFGIYEHTYFWFVRTYSMNVPTYLRYRELGKLLQEFA